MYFDKKNFPYKLCSRWRTLQWHCRGALLWFFWHSLPPSQITVRKMIIILIFIYSKHYVRSNKIENNSGMSSCQGWPGPWPPLITSQASFVYLQMSDAVVGGATRRPPAPIWLSRHQHFVFSKTWTVWRESECFVNEEHEGIREIRDKKCTTEMNAAGDELRYERWKAVCLQFCLVSAH